MAENIVFATMAQDNSKYLLSKNAILRKELFVVKQQIEHLKVENEWLSSQSFNTVEWQSAMQEELGPMEDTMA